MINNSREKAITKTCLLSILSNVVLVSIKAVIGYITGSIAIVMDAVNNLADALGSTITIAGIKIAGKKPDKKHPFGYGRIEYFSSIIISTIIIFAGVTCGNESVEKIIEPTVATFTPTSVLVVVVAVLIKTFMSKFVVHQSKKLNSKALAASGKEATFDAIISFSTVVGALITMYFGISIDGALGVVIAIFIIKSGIESVTSAINDVVGERPEGELTKEIRETVESIPGVLGAYDLVIHNYGPSHAMGSVHIEVPANFTADQIHRISVEVRKEVHKKFEILLTIGIYAVEQDNKEIKEIQQTIKSICKEFDGVVDIHGILVDKKSRSILFDVTHDFTVSNKKEFAHSIKSEVKKKYPEYEITIILDTNYSD